jgi:hypothetical protein
MRCRWSFQKVAGLSAVALCCVTLTVRTVRLKAGDDESLPREQAAERIERLQRLSPFDKEELAQKKERFDKLSAAEQARIRALHANLVRHDEGDRLYGVATRYAQWLRTLPSGQRAELLSLPPEQRLERIRVVMQKQDEERIRELVHTRLKPEDLQAVGTWLREYVEAHKREVFDKLSTDMQQRMRADPDGMRRRFGMFLAMPGRHGGVRWPPPTDEEFERLRGRLSDEAREALDSVDTADKKLGLVMHWGRAAMWSRMAGPPPTREELEQFFAHKLDSKRRDELEKLPREQFDQQLQWEYRMHKVRTRLGEFRQPFHRGPDGRGGRYRGDHGGPRPPGPRPLGRDRPGFGPPSRGGEQNGPPPRGGPQEGPPPGRPVPPPEGPDRIQPPEP